MDRLIPRLSVAIRAYNQEEEVVKALNSVVEQSFDGLVELIIAVDVSKDNTLSVVREYCKGLSGNYCYQILAHQEHQGGTLNLISALRACTGEYVTILDADDYWTDKDKNQKQIEIMDAHPEIGLVYGNFVIESPNVEGGHQEVRRPDPTDNVFTQLLIGNFLGTNVSLFRRNLLDYVDFSVLEEKRWSQDDYFLWLEFANHTRFYHLDDFVAVYTISRDTNAANIPYEACKYDVTTTEVREYFIQKYPQNTELTVSDVWDAHYRLQFKAARIVRDYQFASDAVKSMSFSRKGESDRVFRLCKSRLFWNLYLIYYYRKHRVEGLSKYFL